MQKPMFDALELAQGALHMVVTAKVAQVVDNQISDRTNLDPDALPAKVTSFVIGGAVSSLVRPVTDAAVEKTVTRVKSIRANFKARKQDKTDTE